MIIRIFLNAFSCSSNFFARRYPGIVRHVGSSFLKRVEDIVEWKKRTFLGSSKIREINKERRRKKIERKKERMYEGKRERNKEK